MWYKTTVRAPLSRERFRETGDEMEETRAQRLGHVREVGEGVVLHELRGVGGERGYGLFRDEAQTNSYFWMDALDSEGGLFAGISESGVEYESHLSDSIPGT